MKGLTRNQEKAVLALISNDTLKEAAEACGLSEVTLWRYLQDEGFAKAYRTARRQAVEQAIARLQGLMSEAVDALSRNLNCENPAAENRAAQLVIEQAIKGVELMDLQERIERLEAAQAAQERRRA